MSKVDLEPIQSDRSGGEGVFAVLAHDTVDRFGAGIVGVVVVVWRAGHRPEVTG